MELTAQFLCVLGLVLGTLDYTLLIRRRAVLRRQLRDAALAQQAGLHGLVRVLLADQS